MYTEVSFKDQFSVKIVEVYPLILLNAYFPFSSFLSNCQPVAHEKMKEFSVKITK